MISLSTYCCLHYWNVIQWESFRAHAHHWPVRRLQWRNILPTSAHGEFNQPVQKLVTSLVVCLKDFHAHCAWKNIVLGPCAVTQGNHSPWVKLPRHLDALTGKCALVSPSYPACWIRSWPFLSLVLWQACTTASSPWPPIACVPSWLQLLAQGQATSCELPCTHRRTT